MRRPRPARPAAPVVGRSGETRLFRRFFELIGRLERGGARSDAAAPETKASETKARITRLDEKTPRNP